MPCLLPPVLIWVWYLRYGKIGSDSSVVVPEVDQEFVYVGDEGIIEPSGRTERKGIDLGLRYQPLVPCFVCRLQHV